MHAQPQREIEHHWAVFDEDIVVARAAIDHPLLAFESPQHIASRSFMREDNRRRFFKRGSFTGCNRTKADFVPGSQLSKLPPFALRDCCRSNKTPEARSIRPE